jgi:hypothetical protein
VKTAEEPAVRFGRLTPAALLGHVHGRTNVAPLARPYDLAPKLFGGLSAILENRAFLVLSPVT